MVGPIDYRMNVLDPIQGYLQGLKFGEDMQTQRLGREQTRQSMDIQRRTFEEQQRARQEARAQAAQKKADAEAGQAALARLVELGPNATSDDFIQAWVANPAIRDDLTSLQTMLTEPQNKALLTTNQNIYAAASQGNVNVTRSLLEEQLRAAENSGDQSMVPALRLSLDNLEKDPEGTLSQLRATSSMVLMGLKGPEYIKKINEAVGVPDASKQTEAFRTLDAQLRAGGIVPQAEGGDGRYEKAMQSKAGAGVSAPEAVSTLGKISQDVRNNILPQSVLDTAIRIEEKNAQTDEGLTAQQRIAEEARLRGEYTKRTEDLSSAERNFNIIETSANDQSGAGDIALVTSFMKMLDPGSVVRETEFATAANAGGTLSQLKSTLTKVKNGQFLTPQQREDFKRLSKQYLDAAKQQETQVQSSYQLIIDNYGLNPVNVFGARAVTAQPAAAPAPEVSPAGEPAAAPQETAPVNFINDPSINQVAEKYGVSPQDIWNAMTPEQRARYGK